MADEIDLTQVQALLTQGLSQREIARRLSIPRSTPAIPPQTAPTGAGFPDSGSGDRDAPAAAWMAVHRRSTESTGAPPELVSLLSDLPALQEVAQWWRERKLQRVSPSGPKATERWTIHVERQWIDHVKEEAETLGIPIMTIVNRAFEHYFEGR
jgi:hypothetical protein